jgi:hypothetical protein
VSGRALTLKFDAQKGDELYVQVRAVTAQGGIPATPFIAIANGKRTGTAFTVPTAPEGSQLVGVFIDGVLQPPSAYTLTAGTLFLANQAEAPDDTIPPDEVLAFYVTSPFTVTHAAPAAADGDTTGTAYTLPDTPKAFLGLYRNFAFLRPAIDYTLTGTNLVLTTANPDGDQLDAFYLV